MALAAKKFGFGFGYDGFLRSGNDRHGLFMGGGYDLGNFSLGLGLRDGDLNGGFSPDVDLGLRIGKNKGLAFAAVLYNIDRDTELDVGLGYSGGKQYNLEVNVLLPPFRRWSAGYVITASATVFAGNSAGFHFRSSYWTVGSTFEHTIGATLFVTRKVALVAQYTTSRTFTAALNFYL
jgi:hypothetical protein